MSLLHAVGNPITLEVFPSTESTAAGYIYMDDGETFYHQSNCEKTYVKYSYADNILSH